MGFIKDLRFVLKKLPLAERQTLLFSATITFSVVEATLPFHEDPMEVSATQESITVEEVTQQLYHVGKREKFRLLLLGLIGKIDSSKILIFSNTKSGVTMIKERLTRNGFSAQALSGDIPQPRVASSGL